MVDEGTGSSGRELTLDPPATVRTSRRTVLWGALAAVAVTVGALAVTSGGDDGGPARLPVALGANSTDGREAAMAADTSMAAWVTYVAAEGLPALGGSAPAYRVEGTVDEADVRALAAALGVEGDPSEQDGYWHLESGDRVLDVDAGAGRAWSYWVNQGGDVAIGSGSSDGSTGAGSSGVDSSSVDSSAVEDCPEGARCAPTTTTAPAAADDVSSSRDCQPGTKCAEPSDPATTAECPPDAGCESSTPMPPPVEPVPARELPPEDEARQIALDLLSATGMDVDDAEVTVDGPYDAWYVNVEPTVDGLPVSGWYASVSVGSKGEVIGASGVLGDVESLGDYPTIDTSAAVDRLNDQQSGLDGGTGMDTPAVAGSDDIASRSPAVGTSEGGAADQTATTSVEPAPDAECKAQPDGREICEPVLPTEPCAALDVVDPPAGEEVPSIAQCVPPVCPDVRVDPAVDARPTDDAATGPTTTAVATALLLPGAQHDCGWAPYPIEEPEPIEVVLTEAERILVLLPATDGSGDGYLVPGYRFGGDDGTIVDVAAVADDALAPTTTVAPAVTGDTEPAPLPTEDCEVLSEDDGSGTTHTVQACAGEIPPSSPDLPHLSDGETPEIGVAYYVEVVTHCAWIDFAGRRWMADGRNSLNWPNAVEGGSFTLTSPDEGTFVGDDARTKVAAFTARDDAPVGGCD